MIEVRIQVDEVITRLDQIPAKVRDAVQKKLTQVMSDLKPHLFEGIPGKFLDPSLISAGVETIGSTVIGYIEGQDKQGVYTILPTKAKILRFVSSSGELVRTRAVYRHPFLKSRPIIARFLDESKPWIVDQLEDTVIEGL